MFPARESAKIHSAADRTNEKLRQLREYAEWAAENTRWYDDNSPAFVPAALVQIENIELGYTVRDELREQGWHATMVDKRFYFNLILYHPSINPAKKNWLWRLWNGYTKEVSR